MVSKENAKIATVRGDMYVYMYRSVCIYMYIYIYTIATNSRAACRLSEETAKIATKFSRNCTIENDYRICS